jgi:hypothetical protein
VGFAVDDPVERAAVELDDAPCADVALAAGDQELCEALADDLLERARRGA